MIWLGLTFGIELKRIRTKYKEKKMLFEIYKIKLIKLTCNEILLKRWEMSAFIR